jgi:hypothetical protein
MKAPVILLIAVLLVLIIGAVWWLTTPLDRSAATVWLSGHDSDCLVTTHVDSERKSLPCADVPRHLRGTLHLPSGDHIAIAASRNVPQASIRVMSAHRGQEREKTSDQSSANPI